MTMMLKTNPIPSTDKTSKRVNKAKTPKVNRWIKTPLSDWVLPETDAKPVGDSKTLSPVVLSNQVHWADEITKEGGWRVIGPPKRLCPVKKQYSDYRQIEVLVDTGAAESVIPPSCLPGHTIHQNSASLAGEKYITADGHEIPNRGEQHVAFRTDEGHKCGLKFQVTDVTKPLLSVTQLASTGHTVSFDDKGGKIVHRGTGRTIGFARRGGLYVLQLWVEPENNNDQQQSVFARQGVAR